jgi:hypothetical protein
VSGRKITVVSEKLTASGHYRINCSGVVIVLNVFLYVGYIALTLGREICAVRQDILTPPVGTPGTYFVRIIS